MIQTFEEFLTSSRANIPLFGFILNLILTALLASVLHWVYDHFGNSLSNRKIFGKNFLPLAMITMLIISIVKSSLALSLGLVGALSIIRFRSAIKEPEELIYLFFSISIGLGFGADQGAITLISFLIIATALIVSRKYTGSSSGKNNMHLTIHSKETSKVSIKYIIAILEKKCTQVDLKRLDETKDFMEASFTVETNSFSQLDEMKEAIKNIDTTAKITLLDNKGLF